MRVKEWKGEVVFLHEVAAGRRRPFLRHPGRPARRPARSRDERAEVVLAKLEKARRAKGFDDLPLFAAPYKPPQQLQDDAYELIVAAVAALNPDDMSPREAMEALYLLKQKLAEIEKK